jgi:parallel beta-helix repeat protein
VIGRSREWSVGISISQHASYADASPTVSGNVIEDGATGISFCGNAAPDSAPAISGNTIRNNSSHGMDVRYANDVGTIQGNTITSNGGYGIHIHNASTLILQNRITNNVLSDLGLSGYGVPHISYNVYDTVNVISGGRSRVITT